MRSHSGCSPLERTVAADADESLDTKVAQSRADFVERIVIVCVHVRAGGTQNRAALGWIQLGDLSKQWVKANVRHIGVKETVETT